MAFFLLPGSLQVEIDLGYDVGAEFGDAMEYTRQSAVDAYIFLDWFAIPQITARAEGVNDENTRSDAALAVQSIPFYVEADFLSGGLRNDVMTGHDGSMLKAVCPMVLSCCDLHLSNRILRWSVGGRFSCF